MTVSTYSSLVVSSTASYSRRPTLRRLQHHLLRPRMPRGTSWTLAGCSSSISRCRGVSDPQPAVHFWWLSMSRASRAERATSTVDLTGHAREPHRYSSVRREPSGTQHAGRDPSRDPSLQEYTLCVLDSSHTGGDKRRLYAACRNQPRYVLLLI